MEIPREPPETEAGNPSTVNVATSPCLSLEANEVWPDEAGGALPAICEEPTPRFHDIRTSDLSLVNDRIDTGIRGLLTVATVPRGHAVDPPNNQPTLRPHCNSLHGQSDSNHEEACRVD